MGESFINSELTSQFPSPEKQGEKNFGFLVMRKVMRAFLIFNFLFVNKNINHCLLMITEDSNFN